MLIQLSLSTNSEIAHIVFTSAILCFPLALCKHGCVVLITTLLLIVYIPLLIPPTDTPFVHNVVNNMPQMIKRWYKFRKVKYRQIGYQQNLWDFIKLDLLGYSVLKLLGRRYRQIFFPPSNILHSSSID